MSFAPVKFDLTSSNRDGDYAIYQGATWRHRFELWSDPDGRWDSGDETPEDLTGCTARMHIRSRTDATSTLETLTSGSGITITPLEGAIELYLSATETAALDVLSAVYDLELVRPNGDVDKVFVGQVEVVPEVTR